MRKLVQILLLLSSVLTGPLAAAQSCLSNFSLLGTAAASGSGCYRLTQQGVNNSWGSMWGAQTINLTSDFDFSFAINQCGAADGVVFVLQNAGPGATTSGVGGSLGYYDAGSPAFARSIGVELDFFQNVGAPYNDPAGPHLMLAQNGSPVAVRGPVVVPGPGNCANHTLRVQWTAATQLLTVQLNGTMAFTYPQNLVANIFGGNPVVWFGFVGTTGGSTATQMICPATLTATPATQPLTIVPAGLTTICRNDYLSLSVANQPAGTTFQWSPAAGLSATTGAVVVAAPTVSTTYQVTATLPGGCQTTASLPITVVPRPTVTVSPRQVICPGASAPLRASSAEAGTTHSWSPATGLSTTSGAAVVATPAATTRYTVTTTGPGVCTRQDTVWVIVRPPIGLTVPAPTQLAAQGHAVLTAGSRAAGPIAYSWTPATGLSAPTGATVTAAPAVATTYTVTATDAAGCTEQATVLVQPFTLPNVITPNGDGLNDTFRAQVALVPVTLQVFTRWGRQVFEQADYHGDWAAEQLPAGLYYYRLSTAGGETWKGWLEVVR